MAVIFHLVHGIDATQQGNRRFLAAGPGNGGSDIHLRGDPLGDAGKGDGLGPIQPQRLAVHAFLELQGQDTHADQVGTVDAFEALGDDGVHPQQHGTLGRPVPRRAGAVFLSRHHDQGHLFFRVARGGVEDGHLLTRGHVPGDAASGAGGHFIGEPDISEGAAHHNLVVATPRPEGIVVPGRHAVLGEIGAGRTVLGDTACRGDVVSGHGIA